MFYTVLTFLPSEVLNDTIVTLGIMICFYYGLTAFACVWYFRKELFTSAFNIVFKLLFPLLGGIMLAAVFYISVRDSSDPENGSGAEIGGVGLVFILAVGMLLLGAVLMVICRVRDPAFFRGETLRRDTPSLIVPRTRPHDLLADSSQTGHPLDPLSADEFRHAGDPGPRQGVRPGWRIASVELREPAKDVVRGFSPGDAIVREALVVLWDTGTARRTRRWCR